MATRQTAKAIKGTIIESAEHASINMQDLHRMLHQTKKISYDPVKKSIHFFFFTRDAAWIHQAVRVPFYGSVYRLHNDHRDDRRSA